MSDPTEIANDIKAAIAELADGRSYPDLLEAVDSLAALAHTGQAVDKDSLTAEAAPAGEVASETNEQWMIRNVVKRLASQTLPENEDEPESTLRLSGFIKMAQNALATPATEPAAPGYVSAPSPVEDKDGWQPIETAPKDQFILVAAEFDRPGDWRIKMGEYRSRADERGRHWHILGGSWAPTLWMPLPPPPVGALAQEGAKE